jgi:hypothetical protein
MISPMIRFFKQFGLEMFTLTSPDNLNSFAPRIEEPDLCAIFSNGGPARRDAAKLVKAIWQERHIGSQPSLAEMIQVLCWKHIFYVMSHCKARNPHVEACARPSTMTALSILQNNYQVPILVKPHFKWADDAEFQSTEHARYLCDIGLVSDIQKICPPNSLVSLRGKDCPCRFLIHRPVWQRIARKLQLHATLTFRSAPM